MYHLCAAAVYRLTENHSQPRLKISITQSLHTLYYIESMKVETHQKPKAYIRYIIP